MSRTARTIPDDILAVLTGSINADANRVVITQQLARPDYVAVDKVLRAAGGEWNRKARAHVFPDGIDAAAVIDQLCLVGTYNTAQDDGWFPTKAAVADRLAAMLALRPGMHVLEPSAGEGALVEAVLRLGIPVRISVIERDKRRRTALVDIARRMFESPAPGTVDVLAAVDDFLAFDPDYPAYAPVYDRVIMNPPFIGTSYLDHVRHAYNLLVPGGRLVAILPAGVKFRLDRKHAEFRTLLTRCGTVYDLEDDAFQYTGADKPKTVTPVRSTSARTIIVELERPR